MNNYIGKRDQVYVDKSDSTIQTTTTIRRAFTAAAKGIIVLSSRPTQDP